MRRSRIPRALVRPARRRSATAVTLLAVAALALAGGPAAGRHGTPGGGPSGSVGWEEDLAAPTAEETNVSLTGGALVLRDRARRPASLRSGPGQGSVVLPARDLDRAVDLLVPRLDAAVPAGSRIAVDVRGRDGAGRWTEWREAREDAPAALPRAVTRVQTRITLIAAADGTGPTVRALDLTASLEAAPRPLPATEAFRATVYATRVGLVGGTTANGHVIVADDHFVALPSRRGLSPKSSGQYSVEVCGPARCETAPVWDVGPWNSHDDHWNPSSVRERFTDLPQGRPEAEAAYRDGYHGGLDEFGRRVLNPAGIDLADGTFHHVGLKDNGYVTVTYLWTGTGTRTDTDAGTGTGTATTS